MKVRKLKARDKGSHCCLPFRDFVFRGFVIQFFHESESGKSNHRGHGGARRRSCWANNCCGHERRGPNELVDKEGGSVPYPLVRAAAEVRRARGGERRSGDWRETSVLRPRLCCRTNLCHPRQA